MPVSVADRAFTYVYSARCTGARLTLRHGIELHGDHVPAAEASKYLAGVKRVQGFLTYEVTIPESFTKMGSAAPAATLKTAASTNAVPAESKGLAGKSVAAFCFLAVVALVWWQRVRRRKTYDSSTALHRCVICGETEETNPSLEFRVSQNGADYCQRHLPGR